ncbi:MULTISPECIES: hypothetical protein [Cellvibrio]|uniref:ATPase n=1 Tax=Cellvibrio fibrivorans TaxID=126350 RepID=A0ABU1UWU0_9GAMM|nr:hypothetical protein [Cellvibrio fibrivorans]MDR7089615.1 hypothetical protein [Cellvibrio fibrivorans]
MEIKTFSDLIGWTRQLHSYLAKYLADCSSKNEEERARLLLDYLAEHESKMEKMVAAFERQAEAEVMNTYIYDYLSHQPIQSNEIPYVQLGFDSICQEVFDYHQQVIELYRDLEEKAVIPEAKDLLGSLLAMEQHEAMLLVRQTGRMNDL